MSGSMAHNVLQLYLVADYEAETFNYKQKLNTKQ